MPDSVITRHLTKRKSADGKDGMALSVGLPRSHRSTGEQQQEIREARRMLRECVRCDWSYPGLARYRKEQARVDVRVEDECDEGGEDGNDGSQSDGDSVTLVEEDSIAGFRFYNPSNHDRNEQPTAVEQEPDDLDFDPVEWREREYSTDESSDEEDNIVTTESNGSKHSTYKFEGPDSVGPQLADRKLSRKRKRQKALDEEMVWNDGLAHWMARRDVWCCAHTSAQIQMRESRKQSEYDAAESSIASSASTPRTSTSGSSRTSSAAAEDEDSRDIESRQTSTSTAVTTPELVPSSTSILAIHTKAATPPPPPPPPTQHLQSSVLIPLAPPMLPNHPIRKRITPDTYPEIYSKIILQSRSPSVPINLLVMTRALVQGWKEDGEWPPKNAPPEKSIARKKGSAEGALKSGVKAVGRVLRITGSVGGGESGSGSKEKEKG